MAQMSPNDAKNVSKIWDILKTIIEVIIAAIVGGAAATSASAAGLYTALLS